MLVKEASRVFKPHFCSSRGVLCHASQLDGPTQCAACNSVRLHSQMRLSVQERFGMKCYAWPRAQGVKGLNNHHIPFWTDCNSGFKNIDKEIPCPIRACDGAEVRRVLCKAAYTFD
jgi:hypothetical protein